MPAGYPAADKSKSPPPPAPPLTPSEQREALTALKFAHCLPGVVCAISAALPATSASVAALLAKHGLSTVLGCTLLHKHKEKAVRTVRFSKFNKQRWSEDAATRDAAARRLVLGVGAASAGATIEALLWTTNAEGEVKLKSATATFRSADAARERTHAVNYIDGAFHAAPQCWLPEPPAEPHRTRGWQSKVALHAPDGEEGCVRLDEAAEGRLTRLIRDLSSLCHGICEVDVSAVAIITQSVIAVIPSAALRAKNSPVGVLDLRVTPFRP